MKSKIIFFGILLISLFVLGGMLIKSQTLEQEENLENTELAIYVEGEKVDTIPSKDSGYTLDVEKSSCTYGSILWDGDSWGPVVKINNEVNGKVRCNLYFKVATPYDECMAEYGSGSIQCKIIARLDDTGACPTVNDDGIVSIDDIENIHAYVCSAPDDYGTSYYFRGNVENNWVKFADSYWRILRINGDDSIRMIYAGDASVIDALSNKEEVLKNEYDDNSTKYTQIGESSFNLNYSDNTSVGYMYGNRDGIVEGSTEYNTNSHAADITKYYAKEYTYDAATDRFTLKNPVGVLGKDITKDYVGYYTMNSTTASTSNAYVYKVTSVESSTSNSAAKVGYSFVRYGTTSKEKAQTNTNDSAVKEKVDEWYESHIKGTEYESYLSDTLFDSV